MTAILKRAKRYPSYDLIVDDVVISTGHSKHKFAAAGKRADGTRFDQAADLGIAKISDEVYSVSDVDKFNSFMSVSDAAPVPPTAAYLTLLNEGYKEPAFVDNTPDHPTDY